MVSFKDYNDHHLLSFSFRYSSVIGKLLILIAISCCNKELKNFSRLKSVYDLHISEQSFWDKGYCNWLIGQRRNTLCLPNNS